MGLIEVDKHRRVSDFMQTFKNHFPNTQLNITYHPPSDRDTLINHRLWPEGITVYDCKGKLYVYFRDRYEYMVCAAIHLNVGFTRMVE